jgi:hypothetical protein
LNSPWAGAWPPVFYLNSLRVELSLMLRPTVSRPGCLGIKHQSRAYDHIFITVRQLRVCWCGALSLARGLVCRLQLLLVLASAVILESDHILLSQILDSPFCRFLRLAGLRWRYSTPPPRVWVTLRLTVSQSVRLGVEPRPGLMIRYQLLFDNFCFVLAGYPLWREGGSVFCQSLSAVISQLSVCTVIYILHILHDMTLIYNIYRPLSIWAQYSRLWPISGSFRYNGSPVTWTVVCLTAEWTRLRTDYSLL